MSNRQRHPSLRLGIEHEAEALLSTWGASAYAIARQRADEASSEDMIADSGHVAATIAHKTGQRSSLFSYVFH